MIEQIIRFSLKNKLIIILFITALLTWGFFSLTRLPVDAIPDITNNQVQVISMAPSLAVQEVESFITAPIEVAVANIPGIVELRSISRLGLSVVTVVFKDNVDIYWARQQLGERLKEAEESIPEGLAKTELAPISTGLGEIYQYRLAVDPAFANRYTGMDLRTVQDWIVRREMLGTPGVADINSYGGFVRQYEIAVNPERLKGMDLTLTDIFDALEKNNENTGSAYIDKKPSAYFIRGIGLVKSLSDIEMIMVKTNTSGIPVLIRDVAKVQYGNATRYGALVIDTTEAVGGVVMMLKGENAHRVIDDVQKRIASIQKSLPPGITIEPYLNRSELVSRAIATVSRNLAEGALIVIFILVLLLGNFRAGLIVASVIPLSMLFAVSMMNLFGVSGNLMSLGAIDFGLIVDGAVIIVESVVYRITQKGRLLSPSKSVREQMDEHVFESARRMMNSATFGQFIILIVYLPVLALVGIEGKMFRPMAQVVTFALIGATLLSLTWVPVASSLFLKADSSHEANVSSRIMNKIRMAFIPVIEYALRRKAMVIILAGLLLLASLVLFSRLGGEFIPQLEEGDLAAGVITLQGGSLSNTIEQVQKANKILISGFPEVKHAVCKIGTGEIPTDPTPMETGDYIITLKPKNEWTSATTREELVAKMEKALIPLAGVKFEFQQPIQMRFNELLSGSKQDIAVKIYGDDLNILAEQASSVEQIVKNIKGVEDINVEKVTGLAQVQVEYDRARLAQYGLSVREVNRILRAAFAGSEAGVVYDGEKRFSMVVRLDKDYRQSMDNVKNIAVSLPGGSQIPFDQLASIAIKSGPAQVSREDTKRRITVGFNVRNRDINSVINEVSSKIDRTLKMPAGYYINYGGQFKNLEVARQRLAVAVPVALILIFVLLYFSFRSVKQTLLIFTAVPLAAMGGIFALWLRHMNFSISAGIGFIALFGVAVLNGIVLIAEFNRLEKEGMTDIRERVRQGLFTRLRPVIMTAAVASLGFLPMAVSTSAGAEVQKPLATVVIGGLISATLLTLIVLPVLYIIFSNETITTFFKKVMKRVKYVHVVLFAIFCSSTNLNAQQVSMKDAISIALDSNQAVKSASLSVDALKAIKGSSWDIPKTEFNIQYGQFNSPAKDNGFSVTQSFAFPTVYISQHKLANANLAGGEWLRKVSSLEIATQVKQVYCQLSYLYSRQQLMVFQDSLYTHFFRAAEQKAKTGESNKLEMMTARSQSMELNNRLRQNRSDISVFEQKLATLLHAASTLTIADTGLFRLSFSPPADSFDLSGNPNGEYAKSQVEIARLEKKVEANKMLPDLTVGYFSQTMLGTQDGQLMDNGNRFTGFEAGIEIPLWIFPHTSRVKAARLKQEATEASTAWFMESLEGDYKSLMAELDNYTTSLSYYEQQAVPEADLIIDQTTRSYKAGAMDYVDFVTNMTRALGIKESYLDEINRYNQTVISIELLTGKIF